MLGPFDIAVWLVASLAEMAVLVCSFRKGLFRSYLSLNLYVLALAVSEILSLVVLLRYGFSSLQYTYFYFFSDAILILFKTAAVLGLYLHAFQEVRIAERIRTAAIAAILATTIYSLFFVVIKHRLFATAVALEFSQILYCVTAVFSYVLWFIVLKRRDPRLRLALLVSCFCLYSGLQTVAYGFHHFFPDIALWRYVPAVLGAWLPLSLLYSFTRVHEETRVPAAYLEGRI
jgi:hypothetical protein